MRKLTVTAILGCLLALAACGGSSSIATSKPPSAAPAPATPAGQFGAIPGFGTSSSSAQTAAMHPRGPLSLLGMLLFQAGGGTTSTISISGTYTGFCPSIYSTNVASTGGWTRIYGLSTDNMQDCTNWQGSIPSNWNGTQQVFGAGNLTGLIVTGQGGAASTDGTVTVIVGSAAVQLSCTLGTATRCEATGSIPVNDGDDVGAVIQTFPGDNFTNVHVVILKQ